MKQIIGTPYNQETTCYRFLSITLNDSSSEKSIKLFLDHDLSSDSFLDSKKY